MRVLYVQGAAERAGAERMLHTLLAHLDRPENEPAVAFLADGPFVSEVEGLGVDVLRLAPPPRLREVLRWRRPVRALARAIRETRADIVHANGEKMSVYAGRAARAAGVPCVFWLHDAPGAGGLAGWLAQLAAAATPRAAVVVPSRWMAESFRRRLRVDCRVVPNAIDPAALPRDGDPLAVRAELGWPPDAVILAHVARLQRWKGTDVFLRAAGRVAAAHPLARFLVVGGTLYGREEAYAEELRRLAGSLGLNGRVRFTGYRADALRLVSAADVLVHCSVAPEPFGMVVLEGMALGRAVVATRTRGPEEIVEEGRTGILVPPGDARALAGALVRLAADPAERRRLGEAARSDALERFSAARLARSFEALYASLAAVPARGGRR